VGEPRWHPSFQPRWEQRAACRNHPTWWWFAAGDRVETVEAFSICAECPVLTECHAFALDHPTLLGIWAGTTPEDRQRHRRHERQRRSR
jgi:WhiB family redox-sensing transcriptional regulator